MSDAPAIRSKMAEAVSQARTVFGPLFLFRFQSKTTTTITEVTASNAAPSIVQGTPVPLGPCRYTATHAKPPKATGATTVATRRTGSQDLGIYLFTASPLAVRYVVLVLV
jgi:hypothetical protein